MKLFDFVELRKIFSHFIITDELIAVIKAIYCDLE